MEYDMDGDIDFNAWYKRNKEYFPQEIKDPFEQHSDFIHFLYNGYQKVMKRMAPALHKLMKRQYPIFKTEERTLVLNQIDDVATTTGSSLLFKLYELVQGQKDGINIREKYPDFERWKKFYAQPHTPTTIDETTRSQYVWLNDDEWIEYRDSENKGLLEYFNWEEKRVFEFIDVVQTLIFQYFKELEELNADEWIMYAVCIRDEYEYYKSNCEQIELFIDCGFPEEDMKLSDEEFNQNYSNLSKDIKDKTTEIRNRRIAGEKI